jgi:hypothetical protein
MRADTYQQLRKTGLYNHNDWLYNTKVNFHPKRKGKYKMRISDCADVSNDPEQGLYLDTACFSNQEDLSVIHHYYEGCAYELFYAETNQRISTGIIDGSPFDEVDEPDWEWLNDNELRKLKLIPLPKVTNLIIKPKQGERHKYAATACVENRIMSVVYYHFRPRVKKATEDLIDKYLQDKEMNQ